MVKLFNKTRLIILFLIALSFIIFAICQFISYQRRSKASVEDKRFQLRLMLLLKLGEVGIRSLT